MTDLRGQLLVKPGSTVRLADHDPTEPFGHDKKSAVKKVAADLARLTSVQDRLWAERKHRVLIILQGMDASGKDGAIRHVMSAFNPLGCSVTNFGLPSALELAHDYLWRHHQAVAADGEIAIFNRSHYENVLIVRVQSLVPKAVWSRRYDQINAFEEMLVEEGTTILKFFLHIDRNEQLARLQGRLDDPKKRWKFNVGDLDARTHWDDYMAAYEDALSRCSTTRAPWYIIPANHNWFRNLAIGDILVDALEELKPEYPKRADLPDHLPAALDR
jgi:PPK2 family polyphosphate:nucleotide phosphotransferase